LASLNCKHDLDVDLCVGVGHALTMPLLTELGNYFLDRVLQRFRAYGAKRRRLREGGRSFPIATTLGLGISPLGHGVPVLNGLFNDVFCRACNPVRGCRGYEAIHFARSNAEFVILITSNEHNFFC